MRPGFADFRLPILTAVAVVGCLYAFSPNFRFASSPDASPYAGDFLQEWLGGWIVRHGEPAKFYDVEYAYHLQHDPQLVGFQWNADEYLPIVYPPFYYLLVSPLSLLSVHAAAWVWAGLMLAALAAALWLWRKALYDGLSWPSYNMLLPWLIPAAVLFAPVLESLSSSQKGTLCLLILTGSFVLWNRRRPLTAGLVFAMLAFKPQLVLVIAVAAICKRQWRFVAGGAIGGAALAGLSLLMGVGVCVQYVRFALGAGEYMQTSGYDLYKSHSVWGFAELLCGTDGGMRAKALGLLLAGLVIWQLAIALRGRLIPGSKRFGLQFAALVTATVLLAPHVFTYDLTILLLPMALVIGGRGRESFSPPTGIAASTRPEGEKDSRPRIASALLWLTALLYVLPAISTQVAVATGLQLSVPLMMIYLAAISRAAVPAMQCGEKRRIDGRRNLIARGT